MVQPAVFIVVAVVAVLCGVGAFLYFTWKSRHSPEEDNESTLGLGRSGRVREIKDRPPLQASRPGDILTLPYGIRPAQLPPQASRPAPTVVSPPTSVPIPTHPAPTAPPASQLSPDTLSDEPPAYDQAVGAPQERS